MTVRTRRVAGEIQRALGDAIVRDHADITDGLVTVTDVEVTPDLRHAKVYVSVLGGRVDAERVVRDLNDRSPDLRKSLGQKVYLRHTPALLFIVDGAGERADRIARLIHEWHDERPPEGSGE